MDVDKEYQNSCYRKLFRLPIRIQNIRIVGSCLDKYKANYKAKYKDKGITIM